MALFQWKWLRRFVRSRTSPIPEERAHLWKKRLSVGYMLIAWNAFGFVCYMIYTGRADWAKYYGYKSEEEAAMPPAQYYAQLLKKDKAKIMRFSGLHKVSEMEYNVNENAEKIPDSE